MRRLHQYFTHPALQIGILTGGLGFFVSALTRGWFSHRHLADPLPLAQAFPTLMRTRLYFNWRPPLAHFVFIMSVVIITVLLLRWRLGRWPTKEGARLAAQVAVGLNVVLMTALQVDSMVVAVWYMIGSLLSIWLAAVAAQVIMMPLQSK